MVTVRYFAAARAAAGVETETVQVPPGATVDILLKTVRAAHGDDLGRVLDRCSFLLDEVAVRDRDLPLHDGALVDVLPPLRRRLRYVRTYTPRYRSQTAPHVLRLRTVPARPYSPCTSGFFPISASGAAARQGRQVPCDDLQVRTTP